MTRGWSSAEPDRRAMRPRVWAALACAFVMALISVPASAQADVFGPISLVSAGTAAGGLTQQAEYAHDAAISADGRYVAFDGSFGGVTGVWRRDLASGEIEQVAGGDAELPSISEDGRHISFTTTARLVPEDTNGAPDVYVRDMDLPGSQPCGAPEGEPSAPQCAFTLASAVTVEGSTKSLAYAYPSPGQEEPKFGSVAAGRSAVSADGDEVAFVTTAVSDLTDPGGTPNTPPLQVAVRYLARRETVLVSGAFDPLTGQTTVAPVSFTEAGETFGAVFPGSAHEPGFRPPPATGEWAGDPPPGASISADGSAVAWMGEDVGKQARMLPQEAPPPLYTEPLWRRIAPGSQTPTERVTGGSEPNNPACVASGEGLLPAAEDQSASDPCQGPFRVEANVVSTVSRGIWSEEGGGEANFVPRLSADGYSVAFLASALPISIGLGFSSERHGEPADAYVANMSPGLTRAQALTPLTEIAGKGVAASDPVTDIEISPEGTQVAFTTRRTEFPPGSPAYVSAPQALPGESELYDADLGDDTLTRVTRGFNGEPSEERPLGSKIECPEDVYCQDSAIGAQSPSFAGDGELLAFASTATNLAFGDGNASPAGPFDGSDAFLVERQIFASLATPQVISPPPASPNTQPVWQLGATVLSRRDGSVLVYAEVPGKGTLRAAARGVVRVAAAHVAGSARHGGTGHGAPARTSRRRAARTTTATRTVATAAKIVTAGGGELVTLVLKLARPYAPLAWRGGGLSAEVTLTFTARGHHALRQAVPVMFRRRTSTRHSPGKAHPGGRRRAAR